MLQKHANKGEAKKHLKTFNKHEKINKYINLFQTIKAI